MRSRLLMTLHLNTAPTQDIGAGPHGTRVTFPITGGSFEGDRLRGKVLPGGDDWTVRRSDGVIELDLRITLETDGALIHMTFEGIRDDGAPGAPYFRTGATLRDCRNQVLLPEPAACRWHRRASRRRTGREAGRLFVRWGKYESFSFRNLRHIAAMFRRPKPTSSMQDNSRSILQRTTDCVRCLMK